MELQYTKLGKSVIKDKIDELADKIKELEGKKENYKIVFEGPFNMDEPLPQKIDNGCLRNKKTGESITGVYQIVYKPTKDIYYVGKGNLSSRRYRHLSIFKNKGKGINRESSSEDSPVARQMYAKDSDLSNWDFYYTRIPESDVMSAFEEALIKKMEPEFNNLTMAGKG